MGKLISGLSITPLRIITGDIGDVMHALKAAEDSFAGFGEAYFSSIKKGSVKGWKRHSDMTLNIIVPVGGIRFVVYDDRLESETFEVVNEFALGPSLRYSRLTVSPNLWMAFQGLADGLNLLLNIASIPHDPNEVSVASLDDSHLPKFDWS